jgi:hypothetical protein
MARNRLLQRDVKIIKESGLPAFKCKVDQNGSMSFFCPYCLKDHRHGIDEKYQIGHRVAHCYPDSPLDEKGYWVFLG